MAISFDDAKRLKDAGFTEFEINEFANARVNQHDYGTQKAIDLDSPVWKKVLASRSKIKNNRVSFFVDEGFSVQDAEELFEDDVKKYYRQSGKRSPWDFLKAEYQSPTRVDYVRAVRQRALKRMARGGLRK